MLSANGNDREWEKNSALHHQMSWLIKWKIMSPVFFQRIITITNNININSNNNDTNKNCKLSNVNLNTFSTQTIAECWSIYYCTQINKIQLIFITKYLPIVYVRGFPCHYNDIHFFFIHVKSNHHSLAGKC